MWHGPAPPLLSSFSFVSSPVFASSANATTAPAVLAAALADRVEELAVRVDREERRAAHLGRELRRAELAGRGVELRAVDALAAVLPPV